MFIKHVRYFCTYVRILCHDASTPSSLSRIKRSLVSKAAILGYKNINVKNTDNLIVYIDHDNVAQKLHIVAISLERKQTFMALKATVSSLIKNRKTLWPLHVFQVGTVCIPYVLLLNTLLHPWQTLR